MNIIFEKFKRSLRYYYYGKKNGWHFPSDIAHISGGKMAQGSYEPSITQTVKENLKSGDIFIDVGANIGYFSRLASDIVGPAGNVYSFEVDIENYYALLKNINDHLNVNALHLAVADTNSFRTVYHSTHSACHSLLNTKNHLDGKQFSIPTTTIDNFWETYLQRKPIQLIKIDVEGAELMLLDGMDKIMNENKINTMILEFVPEIIKNVDITIERLYEKMASHFTITIIESEHKSIFKNRIINDFSELKTLSKYLLESKKANTVNLLCTRN